MKGRYLTINTVIRKYQVEINRTDHLERLNGYQLLDETEWHTAQAVVDFSNAVRKGFPEARITWALSWQALTDQTDRYEEIRWVLNKIHNEFGDDVTYIPSGYFANVYNTREQINKDISEALNRISDFMGGYRPKSLIAGFLSSDNIEYASIREGITAVQGNIWSQFEVDGQDGEGSIAYPYYPSKQHFCKPAQDKADFIDCLNFDGWTVDFIAGRISNEYWKDGVRYCSRMGVGPLETLQTFGVEKGLKQMKHSANVHYCDENLQNNPFVWVTNNYEIGEMNRWKPKGCLDGFSRWIAWIKDTWPDVQCPTLANLAYELKKEHKNNDSLNYMFYQKGSGIGASFAEQEAVWIMNKKLRMGLLKEKDRIYMYDLTEYTKNYSEPQGMENRNWSILGAINQKQTRTQDKLLLLENFSRWLEENNCLSLQEKSFIADKLRVG